MDLSKFDFGKALKPNAPQVGFIDFFNDAEHEIPLVESGYRVTLTYSLYFGDACGWTLSRLHITSN